MVISLQLFSKGGNKLTTIFRTEKPSEKAGNMVNRVCTYDGKSTKGSFLNIINNMKV